MKTLTIRERLAANKAKKLLKAKTRYEKTLAKYNKAVEKTKMVVPVKV